MRFLSFLFAALLLLVASSASAQQNINYSTLKTELLTNPLNLSDPNSGLSLTNAYTTQQDSICANILNLSRAIIQVKRADISSSDVASAILVTDYTALPTNPSNTNLSAERRYLSWFEGIMSGPIIRMLNDDGSDTVAKQNFAAMFGSNTGTWARLVALSLRDGSRAEQLFRSGLVLSPGDIVLARQAP